MARDDDARPPPPQVSFRFFLDGVEHVIVALPDAGDLAGIAELSAAERSVVALALGGSSNAEIARRRRVSLRTVAKQIASAFRKLGVRSRAQLTALLLGR